MKKKGGAGQVGRGPVRSELGKLCADGLEQGNKLREDVVATMPRVKVAEGL